MESIPLIESESQEYYAKFDVLTGIRHIYRTSGKYPVEIIPLRRYFDPFKLFLFLQDINNPDRTVDDLMLDCLWNKKGNIEIEITDELVAMLPKADTEKFWFTVTGKEKTQGEPIYFGDMENIGVLYWEKERTEKEAKDDELSIENPEERNPYALPSSYSTHGGDGRERKADKKAETKKTDLYVVPERGDRKKKRASKKLSRPDVIKYFSKVNPRSNWHVTFKAMLKDSWYRDLAKDSRTGHKRTKWARIYSRGIDRLVNTTGQDKRTVEGHSALMIEQKIIKLVWRGFKGQGYSRLEIPLNMKHVKAWLRKRPE